jgi:hypothetical protein
MTQPMPITFRGGRAAPYSPIIAPRLRLLPFLTRPGALPPPPVSLDYTSAITEWPMYGNDKWGCCVWSMIGHMVEAITFYGSGKVIEVPTADLLEAYADVTEFDPNAGPPGDNPTDNGTVIQDALNYWRKMGIDGHQILAFFELNPNNTIEVETALALFGHLCVGISFPASAMVQFNAGKPWDVVHGGDGGIEGGHAINCGGYLSPGATFGVALGKAANGNWLVVTWGRVQEMTPAFWSHYVEEVWTVASQEWLRPDGTVPDGLDTAAANAAFTALTREPGPFGPAPVPPAPPVPPADDFWATIKALLERLLRAIEGKG